MKLTLHLLLLLLFATPALASNDSSALAPLSMMDRSAILRAEDYLNGLKSLIAGFTQVSDSGELKRGQIAIRRPGKMRVKYDAPSKDLIVSDGDFVTMWDGELEQQSTVPVGDSIAEFILRENVKLYGDVTVTNVNRRPAALEITLTETKDPNAGSLTLVFEDKPFHLRQWRVLDAQGRTTTISLENIHEDVELDNKLFHFISPKFTNKNSAVP